MNDKYYYKDGSVLDFYDDSKVLHRLDGPAVEWANGDRYWYVENRWLTEEEFNQPLPDNVISITFKRQASSSSVDFETIVKKNMANYKRQIKERREANQEIINRLSR